MGDMGEAFRAWDADKKAKRASNRETSPCVLDEHGISYESKNGGAHLIVTHNGHLADFWPGTGKFIFRNGGKGRGVFNLIKRLNK